MTKEDALAEMCWLETCVTNGYYQKAIISVDLLKKHLLEECVK